MIIRAAPGLAAPKQFDCADTEIDVLVTAVDVVNLEFRRSEGSTQRLACTAAEFAKWCRTRYSPGSRDFAVVGTVSVKASIQARYDPQEERRFFRLRPTNFKGSIQTPIYLFNVSQEDVQNGIV